LKALGFRLVETGIPKSPPDPEPCPRNTHPGLWVIVKVFRELAILTVLRNGSAEPTPFLFAQVGADPPAQ
jgi:hypothetical protein